MNPQKMELISHYWSCLNPRHHHRTEAIALACIQKSSTKKAGLRKWSDDLYAECESMRNSGMSLAKIAKHYGISPPRVGQVLAKWVRIKERRQFFADNPHATERDFYNRDIPKASRLFCLVSPKDDSQPPKPHWQHFYKQDNQNNRMDIVVTIIRPNASQTKAAFASLSLPPLSRRRDVARAWRTVRADCRRFRQESESDHISA